MSVDVTEWSVAPVEIERDTLGKLQHRMERHVRDRAGTGADVRWLVEVVHRRGVSSEVDWVPGTPLPRLARRVICRGAVLDASG